VIRLPAGQPMSCDFTSGTDKIFFLFSQPPRQALESTQPLIQWVLGAVSPVVKLPIHLHLVLRLKAWGCTSISQYACVAWTVTILPCNLPLQMSQCCYLCTGYVYTKFSDVMPKLHTIAMFETLNSRTVPSNLFVLMFVIYLYSKFHSSCSSDPLVMNANL